MEDPPAGFSVADLWKKKSASDRQASLSKAHSTAHRYLQERGVWEDVAQVLDRHFTMSLAEPQPVDLDLEQPEEPVSSTEVDQIVDHVVSSVVESDEKVTPVTPHSIPDITSIPKTATETADALALALSSPAAPIYSVPNPLITSVPNPLAAYQTTSFPTMSPIDVPSSSKKPAPRVSTCSLDIPMEVFSQEEEDTVVPVSPLSHGGDRYSSTSVPFWSLNEITFFADEKVMDDEWEIDPLVLLA